MSYVGKPMPRVDARDKVMGRAKYAADLCDRNVLTAKILHAEHAHALVKSINVERARGGQAAAHGPCPFLGRRRCCCSRAG